MTYLRVQDRQKTAWRVRCPIHGPVFLTEEEYTAQMMRPDAKWACPAFEEGDKTNPADPGPGVCGETCTWDDAWYEAWMDDLQSQ